MPIPAVTERYKMRFSFDKERSGYTFVSKDDLYIKKKNQNYGFLTEENRNAYKELQIVELNHGMEPSYWCQDEILARICQDERGCFLDWQKDGGMPLTFVQEVSEGNYKVTVDLCADQEEEVFVCLGRRRMIYREPLQAGETVTVSGLVNVCPVIPRTYTTAMEDKTVDVTVIGKGVHVSSICIEPWEGRTLYIAGDSTVTDQSAAYPYYPWNSYCGWGQMLSAYLKEQMAVSNHAHSGLTTESFRTEGHYQVLIDRIQKGDICLIQFGHNDQKLAELKAYEGYKTRMLTYISEIKEKGGVPVIVSPLARNSWLVSGEYNDLLEEYADACRDIAAEQHIPFLDLHQLSMSFVTRHGREDAKRFFFPSDFTHSNDYGAYLFAGYVYEEMKAAGLLEAEPYKQWIPAAVFPEIVIPKEYADKKNPFDQNLFADLERPEDALTRVEALEMVIQTMKFFPTNVYNDMFEDVIGHETYAGTVECAWQNGLIPESMICNHKFLPQKKVTGEEFIAILLNGYMSRKTIDEAGKEKLKEKVLLQKEIKRKDAVELCRQMQI